MNLKIKKKSNKKSSSPSDPHCFNGAVGSSPGFEITTAFVTVGIFSGIGGAVGTVLFCKDESVTFFSLDSLPCGPSGIPLGAFHGACPILSCEGVLSTESFEEQKFPFRTFPCPYDFVKFPLH